MFTTTQFTIANIWKQPKGTSTEEWIKKVWYIFMYSEILTIEKNEIMQFAATWMDPESIILREVRSQTEKDNYHRKSLIHGI